MLIISLLLHCVVIIMLIMFHCVVFDYLHYVYVYDIYFISSCHCYFLMLGILIYMEISNCTSQCSLEHCFNLTSTKQR